MKHGIMRHEISPSPKDKYPRFHLDELPKVVEFIETGSGMATALGWRKEEGERRLTGIEFQLCKTKKFWRSVPQQCEYTSHY